MADIPEEVVAEILTLLPVAPLLRFRCVSKTWRALIDSPAFAKSQWDRSNKPHLLMIFDDEKPFTLDFDSMSDVKHLTYPGNLFSGDFSRVAGPCNGLICAFTCGTTGIFMWNPSTGKHLRVPDPPQPIYLKFITSWGFGYDVDSDDYKLMIVVRLKGMDGGSTGSVVWIYSFELNSWKMIGDFPYLLSENSCSWPCVFVNGAFHWRVCRLSEPNGPRFIAALDIRNLGYRLVAEPDGYMDILEYYGFSGVALGVLDGCLYALLYDGCPFGMELWVMREYGVKGSWTRLVTSTGEWMTPLSYIKGHKDQLLFVDEFKQPVLYDFETKSFMEEDRILESPELLCASPLAYKPSLFWPRCGV